MEAKYKFIALIPKKIDASWIQDYIVPHQPCEQFLQNIGRATGQQINPVRSDRELSESIYIGDTDSDGNVSGT